MTSCISKMSNRNKNTLTLKELLNNVTTIPICNIDNKLSNNIPICNIDNKLSNNISDFDLLLQIELTPYNIPYSKLRLGNKTDGGYIIFNHNLEKLQHIYSYGINNDVSFDLDFTKYSNAPIYMYDHTIDSLPTNHKNFNFIKEEGNSDTIIKHLRTSSNSNKLFLKMDIEGSEWDIFNKISEKHLNMFEQLVIEFHNVQFLDNLFNHFNISEELILSIFRKINKFFYLGHIHGNNCNVIGTSGIPNVIECTYIRKDLLNYIPTIEKVSFPINNIDYPNDLYRPDYILNWWVN